jgi:hypothetical protein
VFSALSAVYNVVVTHWSARHQDDAVRHFQLVHEELADFVVEAQRVEIEDDALAVEDSHHHTFAVRSGHRGNAQVQLLAPHAVHDAAVLRQPPLGDVELGHDLDTADHGRGGLGRGRLHFLQYAVDAVAPFRRFSNGSM